MPDGLGYISKPKADQTYVAQPQDDEAKYGVPSGDMSRATFDSGTVTLDGLAQRVAALIVDLQTLNALQVVAAPAAPTVSSPANGAITTDSTPTIDWSDVVGADTYEIEIASNIGMSSIVQSATGLASSTYTATSLADATYYYHVRARNDGGVSAWTAVRSVQILQVPAAPTLSSPANGATVTDDTPTLDWGDVVGATTYEIDIASDSGFVTIIQAATALATSTYTASPALSETTFYWRVRGRNAAGAGNWGSTRSFTVNLAIAPSFIAQPSITGTARVGEVLSIDLGVAMGTPDPTLNGELRYVSDDTVVATFSADGTYTPTVSDEGESLYLYVTATNIGGSDNATSTATADVAVLFTDLFTRPNGGLGGDWNSTAFVISSNAAINTPALGSNMFRAGKGEFTSDTESWTAQGSNTIESSGGKLKITYVSSATGARLALGNATDFSDFLTNGKWYRLKWTGYREGGALSMFVPSTPNWLKAINVAPEADYQLYFVSTSNTTMNFDGSGFGTGEIARIDNMELQLATPATYFALADLEFTGDLYARACVTVPTGGYAGVIVKLDDATTPANYVELVLVREAVSNLLLYKVVGGTRTLVTSGLVTYRDSIVIGIQASGTTFSIWSDGIQVGTDQTINNAGITSGTKHGIVATELVSVNSFSVGRTVEIARLAYVGGSITKGGSAPEWRNTTKYQIYEDNIKKRLRTNEVWQNGQSAWIHLVRMVEIVEGTPAMVFIDLCANHTSIDFDQSTCEALIRLVRTNLPDATIWFVLFGTWANGAATTPNNSGVITWVKAICDHYDCSYIDIADIMSDLLVAATNTLTDWYTSPDWTHPNSAGNTFIANQLLPYVTPDFIDGGATPWTEDIGDYARIYANSSIWEATVVSRTGLANDGETGTWATVNTSERRSSTAASTISYTQTCSSFGVDMQAGSGTGSFRWRVDGGSWTTVNLLIAPNAPTEIRYLANFSSGSHTFDIEVVSGTITLRRFLAI